MSDSNVVVVRRFFDALVAASETGDWQATLAELDPDVEIDDFDISLDTDHYTGHESFLKWIGVWNESWERWRVEDADVRAAGDDHVISLFQMIATGKGSGIELKRRDAVVYELRDGRIIQIGYYNDQQQALDAVGLEAQPQTG